VTYVRILVCVALCGSAPLALPASSAGAGATGTMLENLNERRVAHGRPSLRPSRSLRRSARAHARYLLRRELFVHSTRIRTSRAFWRIGEILELHRGRRPRPGYAAGLWMRSRTHRAKLLDPAFRWAGAARAGGWFQGQRVTIWVVHLGVL
jgi:uncharacterized protein YkwD